MAKIKIDPKKGKQTQYKTVTLKKGGPSSSTMEFNRGKETRTYEKQDVRTGDPNYGRESKTKPTPEFVKKAQRAGAENAEQNGKSYAAGKTTTVKTPDKVGFKIKINPEFNMRVPVPEKPQVKGKDSIQQPQGRPGKRRLERVSWLSGRNPKTESGHGR